MFFNKSKPIIMGVDVEQGVLKPGTPICVYNKEVFIFYLLFINLSLL